MKLKDLVLTLAEKIVNSDKQDLFLDTIEEMGENVTIDDVLSIFENIGDANDELDSNSSAKAYKAFGLNGKEDSGTEPLHKKFNAAIKNKQESSYIKDVEDPLENEDEDDSLESYAAKLNAGAKSKIKALKSNDKALPESKIDVTDDISAIFEDSELSEAFKEKAQLILETAIQGKINEHLTYLNEAVAEHLMELDEAATEIIAEEVNKFIGESEEKLERYLDYVVEEFMKANEVALESGIKVGIAESIFEGFKGLLAEHNIDVSDEKIDLVDEALEENKEIVESYNKEVEKNIALTEELRGIKRSALIKELSEDLTSVEAEKFERLLENVEYKDDESFTNKVNILLTAYSPSSKITLNEDNYTEAIETEVVSNNNDVLAVMKSLNRFK